MEEYPERPDGFGFSFVRSVFRSGFVGQTGPTVLALLIRVWDAENAYFWKRAALFWPDELMADIGVQRKAMMKARSMAVDGGWLHYEKGARGRPGVYWVLNRSLKGTHSADNRSRIMAKKGPNRDLLDANGSVLGTQSGPISAATTSNSNGLQRAKQRNKKEETEKPKRKPKFDPLSAEVPKVIDTDAFHVAWGEWFDYRKQRGLDGYTEIGTTKQLNKLAKIGPDRAIAAIDHSIAESYQGIFEPKGQNGQSKTRESTRI